MSDTVKELRTAWVAALRSGEYRQGKKSLYNDDGTYCCLGVAGKLVGIPNEEMKTNTSEIAHSYQKIGKSYGLRHNLGTYSKGSLFIHNDQQGWDFNQIADLIESEPKGLFNDD